ncbi:MAG: hypothetical protein ABSD74_14575 [Rhizomicrobium sp.]
MLGYDLKADGARQSDGFRQAHLGVAVYDVATIAPFWLDMNDKRRALGRARPMAVRFSAGGLQAVSSAAGSTS